MSAHDPDPSPLTDTSTFIRIEDSQALRVSNHGLIPSEHVSINPGSEYWADRGPLTPDLCAWDLLVLPDDVAAEEVEALAVSLWTDAGWLSPGHLRLTAHAIFSGPYTIDKTMRTQLHLPSHAERAFCLQVAPERTGPLPKELEGVSPLLDAYKDDVPTGTEWEAIEGGYAMARRLAGLWRVAKSHIILRPDPDSAVNLEVYAANWVTPHDMGATLDLLMPGSAITPQEVAQTPGMSRAERGSRVRKILHEVDISTEERERIEKESRAFDQMAAAHPQENASYSLTLAGEHHSSIVVEVEPTTFVPTALRWEYGEGAHLAVYRVRWIPSRPLRVGSRPTRALRQERLHAAERIETLAAAIARLTGGTIVDEDGFIVAVEDENDTHSE